MTKVEPIKLIFWSAIGGLIGWGIWVLILETSVALVRACQ